MSSTNYDWIGIALVIFVILYFYTQRHPVSQSTTVASPVVKTTYNTVDNPTDQVTSVPSTTQPHVVKLFTNPNFNGDSIMIHPGRRILIAYIGRCDGTPGSGCNKSMEPKWVYKSMQVTQRPGLVLQFQRDASGSTGNLGGHRYNLTLNKSEQHYNTVDLEQYIRENTKPDGDNNAITTGEGSVFIDRDYWPSPLYLSVTTV